MLAELRPKLTYANVVSTLCLFVLLGGGAYAAVNLKRDSVKAKQIAQDAVGSPEIKANAVKAGEIAGDAVTSAKVRDGSLRGVDVGQHQVVNFTANIGNVPNQACSSGTVTGLPGDNRDHLVLTPDTQTVSSFLTYTAEWDSAVPGRVWIKACNPRAVPIDDGNTNFNLLIIDAQ